MNDLIVFFPFMEENHDKSHLLKLTEEGPTEK
jgi:hypothetical protein